MNTCQLCLSPLTTVDALFCHACLEHLPFIKHHCSGCASPTNIDLDHCGHCLTHTYHFDSAFSILEYQAPISTTLLQFKANRLINPNALHLWLYSAYYHHYRDHNINALIPIPSGKWKTFVRGHVPAHALALPLSQRSGLPYFPDLLKKRTGQSAQKGRTKTARHHACPFELNQNLLSKLPAKAQVLLIDDIMTTGASLSHAAELLKEAGCEAVHALTLARTPLL